MKNFFKGKIATAIILVATFVLAGVAIFTAIRLYQLRQTSVAPNVPSSVPKATGVASCGQACNLTVNPAINCPTGYTCLHTSGLAGSNGVCRNTNCTDKTDCTCDASTCSLSFSLTVSTATPTPTATTGQETLQQHQPLLRHQGYSNTNRYCHRNPYSNCNIHTRSTV